MKIAVLFLVSLISAGWASAAALVQSVSGDVRVEKNGTMTGMQPSQRIEAGSTIYTSSGANAILKFDDGQWIALNANTVFRIDGYRFDASKPELDRIAMSIFKGAMRFVTGLIGSRNRNAFSIKTNTATIGIRGTDGAVAVQTSVPTEGQPTGLSNGPSNPGSAGTQTVNTSTDFLTVNSGVVSGSNLAGTTEFQAGTSGIIASPTTLPMLISSSALPSSISTAFGQLNTLTLSTTVGLSTGSLPTGLGSTGSVVAAGLNASGAAVGGLGVGTIAVGAAIVGGIISASGNSSGPSGTN